MAVEEFLSAVEAQPTYARAYNAMGVSYDFLGDYAKAIEAYKKTIQVEPKGDYAHNNLGYSYLLNGDFEQAIESFKRAVALNGKSTLYHNNLGFAYAKSGKFNLALEEFKLAVGEKKAHASLARVVRQNGIRDAVEAQIATAPAKNPSDRPNDDTSAAKTLADIFSAKSPVTKTGDSVVTESQHEVKTQFSAVPVINPSESTRNNLSSALADIYPDQSMRPPDVEKVLSASKSEVKTQSAAVRVINPSGVLKNEVRAKKILEDIFSAIPPVSTQDEERVTPEPQHETKDQIAAPLIINPASFAISEVKARKSLVSTLSDMHPVIAQNEVRIAPEPQTGRIRGQASSAVKIEVSNGNGVNRMARMVGEYLRSKGFLPIRLTNAVSFHQLNTRIYYNSGYEEEARKLAFHLRESDRIELIPDPPKGRAAIRVVIGKDLAPYRSSFQNG